MDNELKKHAFVMDDIIEEKEAKIADLRAKLAKLNEPTVCQGCAEYMVEMEDIGSANYQLTQQHTRDVRKLAAANDQIDLYKQRIQQLHASHERKDHVHSP